MSIGTAIAVIAGEVVKEVVKHLFKGGKRRESGPPRRGNPCE
jgi:hypothetical protein